MNFETIVDNYSYSIYSHAKKNNSINLTINSLQNLTTIIKHNKNIVNFIKNPTITIENKLKIITNLLKKLNAQSIESFTVTLIKNKAFHLIDQILERLKVIHAIKSGMIECYLLTNKAAEHNKVNAIKELLEDYSKQKVYLCNIIAPSIIGGMIVYIKEKSINLSYIKKINIAINSLKNSINDKDLLEEIYN